MTAARRLAAILAVDVVGYSRLMGEDEAGACASSAKAARPTDSNRPVSANSGHSPAERQDFCKRHVVDRA